MTRRKTAGAIREPYPAGQGAAVSLFRAGRRPCPPVGLDWQGLAAEGLPGPADRACAALCPVQAGPTLMGPVGFPCSGGLRAADPD